MTTEAPPVFSMGYERFIRVVGQTASEASDLDAGIAAGRLFLVKKDSGSIAWQNCGSIIVPYEWRPRDGRVEHIDVQSESELHTALPFANTTSFGAAFAQGGRVRVSIASAGNYHVDENLVRIPADCKATHFVLTIGVGKYAISSMRGGVVERKLEGSDQSELDKCTAAGQDAGPSDACRMPVEIFLREIERHNCCVMPEPTPPPSPPVPCAHCKGDDAQNCARSVNYTGDLTVDINALGQACGTRFGLVAVAPPYSRKLSQDQGVRKEFELELEAGCYRVFAVGDSGMKGLSIAIKDASDTVLSASTSSGPIAVLGPEAPFCFEGTRKLGFFARVEGGAGRYAMWLWKKK